jgi:hypothetical protein
MAMVERAVNKKKKKKKKKKIEIIREFDKTIWCDNRDSYRLI